LWLPVVTLPWRARGGAYTPTCNNGRLLQALMKMTRKEKKNGAVWDVPWSSASDSIRVAFLRYTLRIDRLPCVSVTQRAIKESGKVPVSTAVIFSSCPFSPPATAAKQKRGGN